MLQLPTGPSVLCGLQKACFCPLMVSVVFCGHSSGLCLFCGCFSAAHLLSGTHSSILQPAHAAASTDPFLFSGTQTYMWITPVLCLLKGLHDTRVRSVTSTLNASSVASTLQRIFCAAMHHDPMPFLWPALCPVLVCGLQSAPVLVVLPQQGPLFCDVTCCYVRSVATIIPYALIHPYV